jgi:hypothetical protein
MRHFKNAIVFLDASDGRARPAQSGWSVGQIRRGDLWS